MITQITKGHQQTFLDDMSKKCWFVGWQLQNNESLVKRKEVKIFTPLGNKTNVVQRWQHEWWVTLRRIDSLIIVCGRYNRLILIYLIFGLYIYVCILIKGGVSKKRFLAIDNLN